MAKKVDGVRAGRVIPPLFGSAFALPDEVVFKLVFKW